MGGSASRGGQRGLSGVSRTRRWFGPPAIGPAGDRRTDARFEFLAISAPDRDTVKVYPLVDDLVRAVPRVGMPQALRLIAPGGTRSTQRAVGNPAFPEQHLPRREQCKSVFAPSRIPALGD